jgi:hypothetical protein
MNPLATRRAALAELAALAAIPVASSLARIAYGAEGSPWRLSTFEADVTPPLGHPLLGNNFAPARAVADPLFAKGIVLHGAVEPIVLVAVDWCEIRNDAYRLWRTALAKAAGTTVDRVFVTSVHQHDAPYFDTRAQQLLDDSPGGGKMCDADFHRRTVERVAAAVKKSLGESRVVTQIGLGQAKIEGIASNRRVEIAGKASFRRYSRSPDATLRALPDGTIDPWLKTISFWNEDVPLVAISSYACHPMSYYGTGEISTDFVGLARQRREQDDPHVFQIYTSGCCGDVTAGKYNDGAKSNRGVLAERLYRGLVQAWDATRRQPLTQAVVRSVPVVLPHSELASLSEAGLRAELASQPALAPKIQAALGLSSRLFNPAGHAIDLQAIDFGTAQLALLPAESFVAYQLLAQAARPDSFVMALGFGECAPGYIPTNDAFREGYREEHHYCWVAPGTEKLLADGIATLLAK